MSEIPQELINEILLFSRVKSLLRFKCLSKSLRALIDSLDFINSHLARSSENMIHRKLIFESKSSSFHICDMNDGQEEEVQLKPLASVFGYCHGLVLVYRSLHRLAVWNPFTRLYNNLPHCKRFHSIFGSIVGSGLGYDSIDGYKVVLIIDTTSDVEFWNFGVRSNTWRRIYGFPYPHYYNYKANPSIGMFADGSLWWLPLKFVHKFSQSYKILAYDLRSQIFLEVPLPICPIPCRVVTDLHILEGHLCISFYYHLGPEADLYMRSKDGFGRFSWTKLYSVKEAVFLNISSFERVKVLGCLKGGNIILLDFGWHVMVSYDIEKQTFEKVELKINRLLEHPFICNESLASVECFEKTGSSCKSRRVW